MQVQDQVRLFGEEPRTSGFVLDFDGTLSPIVPEPPSASIVPEAPPILRALQNKYGLVAIVSGRRAQDVAERVAVPGLRYIGLYGGEEYRNGKEEQPSDAAFLKARAAELAEAGRAMLEEEGLEGCRVEQKDMAVSLHFRNSSNPAAADILMAWAQDAGPQEAFKAGLGRKVIDFRPRGFSKALALERLVDEYGLRRVLVAGDDLTDVEAMRRAGELEHISPFRVGVHSPEAPRGLLDQSELIVGSPQELVELLGRFVSEDQQS